MARRSVILVMCFVHDGQYTFRQYKYKIFLIVSGMLVKSFPTSVKAFIISGEFLMNVFHHESLDLPKNFGVTSHPVKLCKPIIVKCFICCPNINMANVHLILTFFFYSFRSTNLCVLVLYFELVKGALYQFEI